MNRTLPSLAAQVLLLVCLIEPVHAGESNAAIPYRTFADLFQPIAAVDPAKLDLQVFVSSTNQTVSSADIRLTIHSAVKGLIPVPLNTNGQVIRFPIEKELRRENPLVVANQPAGSMRYLVTIQLPPTNALAFPYRRLADGVAEMNKSIKAQAGMLLSVFAPKVRGVIFFFPKSGADRARVEVASAAGNLDYTENQDGQIKLELTKALVAENPTVRLSEAPLRIVPDLSGLK